MKTHNLMLCNILKVFFSVSYSGEMNCQLSKNHFYADKAEVSTENLNKKNPNTMSSDCFKYLLMKTTMQDDNWFMRNFKPMSNSIQSMLLLIPFNGDAHLSILMAV